LRVHTPHKIGGAPERAFRRRIFHTISKGAAVRSDDLLSIVIALAVTVLFASQTLASWPAPFQLSRFEIQYDHPVTALRHRPSHRVALNANN
jgi:hypothetical protein